MASVRGRSIYETRYRKKIQGNCILSSFVWENMLRSTCGMIYCMYVEHNNIGHFMALLLILIVYWLIIKSGGAGGRWRCAARFFSLGLLTWLTNFSIPPPENDFDIYKRKYNSCTVSPCRISLFNSLQCTRSLYETKNVAQNNANQRAPASSTKCFRQNL